MKTPWNNINFALLTLSLLIVGNLPIIAACVDLDGDGTAETCIGGSSSSVPMPSQPKPSAPSNASSGSSSSSHSKSSHHSSMFNNWQQNSDMIDSWINEYKLKAAQQKLLQEKQKLEAEIQEAKKKEEEAKKKAEAEAKKKYLDKKTAENKVWLQNLEDKTDKTPGVTNGDLSGKVKLLRDPSLYNSISITNPASDQRTADIERLKLKNISRTEQSKVQPSYFGPDPKTLNEQELQYQIKLLDSQIIGCQTNTSLKCSAEFLNMLNTEKQKYQNEFNLKNTNSIRTGSTSSIEGLKKLNLKGTYNLK